MKLVMTLLVRDEIDIVDHSLSFHLASGVDHIVAIDNGSIDGTRDLLADFERQGVVTVIDEPEQDFSQSIWMTKAALIARDRIGADWILHNDADEFWVSRNGNLKELLRKSEADALTCPRLNMLFPWDDDTDEHWTTKCIYRARNPVEIPILEDRQTDRFPCPYIYLDLPEKVLTKAAHLTKIAQGNHRASFDHKARIEPGEIDIFHFPIRSQQQFRSKIMNGGEAYNQNTVLPPGMGWHWRRWYRILNSQGIEAVLSDALPGKAALTRDLADGIVIEDHRMKSLLDRLEQQG